MSGVRRRTGLLETVVAIDAHGYADGVYQDVDGRRVPAADEVLVHFVARCVRDPGCECRRLAAERAQQERTEDRVLRHVRALAQDGVPAAEPGAEARDGR